MKVDWANEGTWILFCNPATVHVPGGGKESFSISFSRPEYEDWGNGMKNAHYVEEFMDMVNHKCNDNIKVSSYKKNKESVELKYEDGSSIIWDYKEMKGINYAPQ